MASNNQKNPGSPASSTACFSSLPSNVKYSFDVDDSDDENVGFSVREDNDTPKDCEFLNIDGGEEEPFDYHLDHLEFKYNEEMIIFEFIINQVHLHYSDSSPFSIPTEPKELPNDEEIKKKLEKHHGPLDFDSSDENRVLFQNFKTDVICEYKKWIKSANEILKEIQAVKSKAKSKFNLESILAQINSEMCPIKPRYLIKRDEDVKQSPNVLKSEMEPYDLPRPSPSQFIQETIAKLQKEIIEQETTTTTTEVQVQVDEDRITRENFPFNDLNLAFFDPIIDKFDRLKLTKGLKYPLVKTILQVLKRFPLGISPNVLYEEFEIEHHYKIDYTTLGFSSFEELLTENDSVFSVFKSEMCNLNLVFPAFLEVNPNIDEIQKKICHWVLIMLQFLKKPVPVEKVTDTLNQMFPLNLNVKAYGLTEEMYYRKIVGLWASNRVHFIKCPSASDVESEKLSLFMMLNPSPSSNPNDKSFEKYSEGKSAAYAFHLLDAKSKQEFLMKFQLKDSSIFIGFELPSVSDFLKRGLKYKVRPDMLINPMDFYVGLQSQLPERNAFVSVMTEFYDEKAHLFKIRDSEFLHPGIFIAVKFEDEWHRGKIIKLVEGKKEIVYKVYMVDRGVFSQHSRLKEMRYLDNTFATFPMQSIPARLRRSELQKILGKNYIGEAKWDDDIKDFFYSFLVGKNFMIIPVSRSSRDSVWEVDLYMLDGNSNVFKPDLMDAMKKFYSG